MVSRVGDLPPRACKHCERTFATSISVAYHETMTCPEKPDDNQLTMGDY